MESSQKAVEKRRESEGKAGEKQERIITQKWIANWMLGNEAWSGYRRTGYPRLMPATATGNKSGGIVDSSRGARRMPYPTEENATNYGNVQRTAEEMRNDDYTTNVTFKLSTRPKKGVDIQVAVDEAYAQTYNTLHEIDFEVFPAANVSFNNGGTYVLAPDDQKLPDIKVMLKAFDGMREDQTYIVPLTVTRAANINWDAERKRVYVYNNPNVQFLLDNNEEYLQPLRKAGMKVIVSILGNHDEAGVAQLSDMDCREFARELAAYCDAYNLDGVAFDDEYSNSPDLSNPWLAQKSTYAASRLAYECKKAMPDKIVSLYNYGSIYSQKLQVIDGITPGEYCDYAVGDYNRSVSPGIGMTLKQCGGMSIELNLGRGDFTESGARQKKE